jgi:hypothetical protein
MEKKLWCLKEGDLITFKTMVLQEGQNTIKTIRSSVKKVIDEIVYIDTNYLFDTENGKRMMPPNIRIGNDIKPLIFVKKSKIIDYQKINEEYSSNPTSKYEAIELLKTIIKNIILENFEGGLSTSLHGGGDYFGIQPSYSNDMLNQNKEFPEDSLRIIARKNMDDIKKQMDINNKSADEIEKKAIEDFCFKHPSLLIYL